MDPNKKQEERSLEVKRSPRLMRIPQAGMFSGVLAGIAYRLGMSSVTVRLVFAVVLFLAPATVTLGMLCVYAILNFVLPTAAELPADYDERTHAQPDPEDDSLSDQDKKDG